MKLVLDMDTGVDDAVAIVLAMTSPELEALAIATVAGNAPVAECTRNTLLLLDALRPEAPPRVAEGADRPLARELLTAPEVHGDDGLGGSIGSLPTPSYSLDPAPACELLRSLPLEDPGEIVLVTTGPLTNLAAAIADEPELIGSYRRIVVMGGAFHVPGNTGPVAEFNVYVDPEAARAVLGSGGNITLVPLDATTRAPLMRSTLESYAAFRERPEPGSPPRLSAILARALDFYMRYQFRESGLDGGFMHDPLAVAAAFAPEILTTSRALVDVGVGQEDRGCTSLRPPSADSAVDVAFDLNEEAFERLLVERVLEPVFVG